MKTLFKSSISGQKLDMFHMKRYEMIVPSVDNYGNLSPYLNRVRDCLIGHGFTGWTEYETCGYWQGQYEPGICILIFSDQPNVMQKLTDTGRECMPDQDCVQVTMSGDTTVLVEA